MLTMRPVDLTKPLGPILAWLRRGCRRSNLSRTECTCFGRQRGSHPPSGRRRSTHHTRPCRCGGTRADKGETFLVALEGCSIVDRARMPVRNEQMAKRRRSRHLLLRHDSCTTVCLLKILRDTYGQDRRRNVEKKQSRLPCQAISVAEGFCVCERRIIFDKNSPQSLEVTTWHSKLSSSASFINYVFLCHICEEQTCHRRL